MIPYDLIRKKQQGEAHSPEEIRYLVDAFTEGNLPDYQMAAWLMAVHFRGMTIDERHELVRLMIESGRKLDFSHLDGYVADKHSTGGVGDKVSLILGPLVAACGVYVPMLSGRGLGHTGGTLDKLDAIPGFYTSLDLDAFQRIVAEVGVCIMGQTDDICPADKKMYALRDVTATVGSLPLICGSIMSKKIAEGIRGLVLDVKCGSGAFMGSVDEARTLAQALRETGEAFGVDTVTRITDMSQPLGKAAGVWCEVQESIEVLEGGGPPDLIALTKTLSADILRLAGQSEPEQAVEEALASGRAREKFEQMVTAQGGDLQALADPQLHAPNVTIPLIAPQEGYLAAVDTYECGMALITAGAGRLHQGEDIDPTAGFVLEVKIGDQVQAGDEIGRVFGNDEGKVQAAAAELLAALQWQDEQPSPPQLILE
ncbi:MAG: thymidine phosphorylase [Fidelibacterota bacterium]|nr:MAG: thymidine phosphorylase [Candidatus Neomarinimicrobiota bacterium]